MIDKQDLIKHLDEQGKGDLAAQVGEDLPDKVDLQTHADQLRQLGLDPE